MTIRQKAVSFIAALICGSALALPVWAAVAKPPCVLSAPPTKYGLTNPLGSLCLPDLIGRLISQVLPMVGALFLVMFMWGGVQWMTAGGDSKKVEGAVKTLRNAIIGIAIVVFADIIVYNIVTYFAFLQ